MRWVVEIVELVARFSGGIRANHQNGGAESKAKAMHESHTSNCKALMIDQSLSFPKQTQTIQLPYTYQQNMDYP